MVLSATTELASFGKQIRNITRIDDFITITGKGFGADPLVLWEHTKGVENIKPDTKFQYIYTAKSKKLKRK